MKTALMRCNQIMTLASIVIILLALIGIAPAYVVYGFTIGYLTARLVMKKFVFQLDDLSPGQLPNSNFAFNMLVYTIVLVLVGRLNVYAMLSSVVALIAYRKMFFIFVEKIMEGGFDGNNN